MNQLKRSIADGKWSKSRLLVARKSFHRKSTTNPDKQRANPVLRAAISIIGIDVHDDDRYTFVARHPHPTRFDARRRDGLARSAGTIGDFRMQTAIVCRRKHPLAASVASDR